MKNPVYDESIGKLILRLTLGGLMIFHGIAKIGNSASLQWMSGELSGLGLPGVLAYGVFVGEILAPILLIAGLWSRIAGLLVVVNMLFAIVLAHADELLVLGKHGGWAIELQAFYLFCGLAIVFLGSGRYALKPD